MRTVGIITATLAILAILGIAIASCSTEQRQQARTAFAVANEACDVVVLLDDDAKEVCVPIGQVEELARTVLSAKTVRIDVPVEAPRIHIQRTTVRVIERKPVRIEQPEGGAG